MTGSAATGTTGARVAGGVATTATASALACGAGAAAAGLVDTPASSRGTTGVGRKLESRGAGTVDGADRAAGGALATTGLLSGAAFADAGVTGAARAGTAVFWAITRVTDALAAGTGAAGGVGRLAFLLRSASARSSAARIWLAEKPMRSARALAWGRMPW